MCACVPQAMGATRLTPAYELYARAFPAMLNVRQAHDVVLHPLSLFSKLWSMRPFKAAMCFLQWCRTFRERRAG